MEKSPRINSYQRVQESWKIERDDGSKRKRKWRNLPRLIRIYAFQTDADKTISRKLKDRKRGWWFEEKEKSEYPKIEERKEERGKEGRKISQREDSRVPGTKDLWNNRIDARPTSGERRDRLVSPWRPPLRSFPANSLTSRGKKIEMVRKSILVYDLLRTEQPEEGFTEKEIVEQISNKHDIMPGKSLRKQVAVALRRGVDFGIIAKKNNKFRFKSQSNVLFFFFSLSLLPIERINTKNIYVCAYTWFSSWREQIRSRHSER